jgi:phage I-like protein
MKTVLVVADQAETWCHLAPFGTFEYLVMKGGQPVLDKEGQPVVAEQVLDAQGLQAVVAAFAGEVLVDREHWSVKPGDTTAMGWICQLELRGDGTKPEDGIWCLIRWTDIGAGHVQNKRLRWLSPVWDTDAEGRPVALVSAALTNTARFKDSLSPVVNKADGITPTTPDLEGEKDKTTMNLEEIAKLLGLDATATPEQVAEKIKELQAFKADSEKAAVETEAEAAYAENKDKICNKADFVSHYVANPELGRAFCKVLAKPVVDAKDPVTNKADAKLPSFAKKVGSDAVLNKFEQWQAMPDGKEKNAFLHAHATKINDCAK